MRQDINVDPERKLFEAYMSFSGGHNSETANDRLRDDEFTIMENVDLSGRDSAKRRTGRTLFTTLPHTSQGHFLFYRVGEEQPDHIFAAGGRLYLKGVTTVTEIVITDGGFPWTFQTTKNVEAVQYGTTLFIATGTKLVELSYDTGYTAMTVTPYTPSVQEVIYIGTNGLADDPSAYVQDGVSADLEVVGVSPELRSGAVNTDLNFTAYINKPASITSVDYKWEYRISGDSTIAWTLGEDWVQDTVGGKTFTMNVDVVGTYDVQVTVRDHDVTTDTDSGSVVGFRVESTLNKENNTQDVSGIQTCTRIRLHWDRVLLFGDTTNPYLMYISDLKNPRYIPSTLVLSFDTGKLEAVNSVVRFQDYLVVMTNTTIQTLIGKDPSTYARFLIHDTIGCIAPLSASVVGNQIIFLSYSGVTSLRPNPYRIEAMNVKRTDIQIHGEITDKTIIENPDLTACSTFHDNQYWICFPETKIIYRFYYETGVWVRDKSSKLDITQFTNYGGLAYNLTKGTSVYTHSNTVWSDAGEIYTAELDSKTYNLGYAFNYKKLRKLYVLARHFSTNTDFSISVRADSALALTPGSGIAVVSEDGTSTTWSITTTPNVHFYAGTVVGTWLLGSKPLGDVQLSVQESSVQGKCRRVKINIKHAEDAPFEIYGFGFEFKLKKI